MTGTEPSALRRLAERAGILPSYVDQSGTETRVTRDDTRERLLAALGLPAASDAEARETLHRLEREDRARWLPPVRVMRASELATATIPLELPGEVHGDVHVRATLLLEQQGATAREHRVGDERVVEVPLLRGTPTGYHTLRVELAWARGERVAEQRLIVVPDTCWEPRDADAARRRAGLTVNLYTVRSGHNRGIGDFTDLATLMAWSAGAGLGFVGVNPLHALYNRGAEVSPYNPVSRLYRNTLYLDLEAVPELAASEEARRLLAECAREYEELRAADRVQYERLARLQRPVLEALHRAFATRERDAGTARGRAYAAYRTTEGQALDDHATFMALEEEIARREGAPRWWREWPEEWRDARSAAVRRFRAEHAEAVDFHRWVQFELDRQLGMAADAGRRTGQPVRLYQDVAVGSSGGGSDAWAFPDLFVHGVSMGAPPDPLGPEGQDWGIPPINPMRLADSGYAYWTRLLRAAFRHAGALRVDHALGLFRQFWIPWGMTGAHGAYVRAPTDDLLGILALESARHEALVVGEDLGTVPPEVPPTLRRWRMLSSKVMMFERAEDGGFRASTDYEPGALATANTHDLPTIAGWWQGRDVELRERLGRVSPEEARRERETRARECRLLVERLRAEGLAADVDGPRASAELRGAVHRFLRRTPSRMVGLSLDDLVGEADPVNVPGATQDEYPSWTRRLSRSLEDIATAPDVRVALGDDAPD